MAYLFFIQLMAHQSSMGFVPWVTDSATSTKSSLQREYFELIVQYNQLSDSEEELWTCICEDRAGWLQCPKHGLSTLGHQVKIEDIARDQNKLNRRINRIGANIARLTKQSPC